LKILLLEYITAGGFNDAPLPASLLREGLLMRDALLRDFGAVPQVEITTTYDVRLGKPALHTQHKIQSHAAHANSNPTEIWQTLLSSCDVALVVAPETDGILHHLTQLIEASPAVNLGCDATSVKLTTSKLATSAVLQQSGITTILSYKADTFDCALGADKFPHGYVLKPDDGAGCDNAWYFVDSNALDQWLQSNSEELFKFIIQPYQTGLSASFSMLCKQGKAWALACNEQKIEIDKTHSHLKYSGSYINALASYSADFNELAQRIADAIPGLNGYVGVDVIIEDGVIYVVEINPRITTSYIGLQQSLQHNPAELILALTDQEFALPNTLTAHAVEVNVNA
jgi:predicted ATP-grasp superfamily ATP-dependent carboligase